MSKCLFVIQDGLVELTTTMDNGTEFIIETVGRGVCLNFRTFLTEDELHLTARCYTPVTMFVINKENFTKVVARDTSLIKSIQSYIDDIVEDEKTFELDITSVKPYVKTYDKYAVDGVWRGDKAERAQKISNLFKNTVMKFLLKNREERKVPKLSDILKISIEK